jgi:hypothetical protein
MGPPVKVMIDGRPVFLCCEGCRDQAKSHPRETLETAERLKARSAAESHEHHGMRGHR